MAPVAAPGEGQAGSRTVKLAQRPGSEAASTVPPWSSAIRRQRNSPSPLPCFPRVPVDGGSPSEVTLGNQQGSVRLSPQGDLIAYIEPQGGSYSVFVRTYPELGPRVLAGSGDYGTALWSADGSTLYAFQGDNVEAFAISREPRLEIGGRKQFMELPGGVHRPALNPGLLGGFYVLEDLPGAGIVTSVEVVANWVQNLP